MIIRRIAMDKRALVISATFIAAWLSLSASAAEAARSCRSNQQYVANWGCVSKAVIAQAKKNCVKVSRTVGRKVPFTECMCEDAKVIGACGD
jgi:hypothetical protein